MVKLVGEDNDIFEFISEELVSENGYDNIISADLYPAAGDSDDFMYGMHHFTSHHMLSSHKGSVRATLCIILYHNCIGVTQQTSVNKPYAHSFGNMRNQLPRPTELFFFMWNFCSLRQFYPKRKKCNGRRNVPIY